MRRIFPAIFILSVFIFIYTADIHAEERINVKNSHIIAAELSILGQTNNFEDPYSLPAGIGILYEYHGFSIPMILGLETEWFGFVPINENYNDSSMIVPSLILAYSFIIPLSEKSSLQLMPALSAGQYFRSFERNNQTYKGSKPIIKSGLDIMLITEKNMVFTIGFFYTLIMDNNVISFPGYRNRIGYAF